MNEFSIQTPLMRHQETAAEKLSPLKVGALFMEMGTGKSRTAIELIFRKQKRIDKVIWITPVSLKNNVRFEIRKHTTVPESDIDTFNHKTTTKNIARKSWYIVGIESVSGSARVATALRDLITTRSLVIVDESSYIKGYSALRTARMTQYASKARYRYILTGTPISQGVVDLYSQFRFLSQKILGYPSFYSFARNHLQYDAEIPDRILKSFNIPVITAKIEPYTYQVRKEECIDLPEKVHSKKVCGMTSRQMERYRECKEYYFERLLNRRSQYIGHEIFALFSALQQIASGFWHRRTGNSWRLEEFPEYRSEMLLEMVQRIDPAEKVIIWAKYHYEIDKIIDILNKHDCGPCVRFDGNVSEKDRVRAIEKFRNDARFFISTQSCGGHGLTLNEAAYTIFYSNGFKYSERLQAEDRNHRIGQNKKVNYIDIIPDCRIEWRIQRALDLKQDAVTEFRNELMKIINDDGALEKLKADL